MMRADALNWNGYGGYMETTALSSNFCSTYKDESKRIIVHETLLQSCSANDDKLKKASSTKLYCRTIMWTLINYVLERNANQNALLRKKNTQRMRLHMMCLTNQTSLTYLNAEETTLTCNTKDRTWPLKESNTLRR